MEIWKDIEYNTNYQISNLGRVRNKNTLKLRKSYLDKDGYCVITLGNSNYKVHRLVALAFIPNTNINYDCINHKDENKQNNTIDNLEWCDKKYNDNYGNRNIKLSKQFTKDSVITYDENGNILEEYRSLAYIKNNVKNSGGIVSALIYNKDNRYFQNKYWFYKHEKFDKNRRLYKRIYLLKDINDNLICDGDRNKINLILKLPLKKLYNIIHKEFTVNNKHEFIINNYKLSYNLI